MTDFEKLDAQYRELEQMYKACIIGKYKPTSGIANGELLNQLDPENFYDPSKMYIITPEGIRELSDG